MINNLTFITLGAVMPLLTKKALPTPQCRKAAVQEYRAVCCRAKDIGAANPWLSCYALAAWFIAMNRCNNLSPDENYAILEEGLKNNWIFRKSMGKADHFISRNKTGKPETWKAKTAAFPYENDWSRTLLPQNPDCDLAFDFTECEICKLCRDEGCFALARYLCQLDHMMAQIMGLRLERTTTLADGGKKCDFRYHRL